VTTIIVEVEANQIRPKACLLSQLDNSRADYWLYLGGAHFQGTEKAIHLDVSRWLATTLLRSKACHYSQWIPGEDDVVADSLSRDHHLAPEPLTHLLRTFAKISCPRISTSTPYRTQSTCNLSPGCGEGAFHRTTNSDKAKLTRAFRLWQEFRHSIGFGAPQDVFLDTLSPDQRTLIFGAFTNAIWQAEFNGHRTRPLASATVRDTMHRISIGDLY